MEWKICNGEGAVRYLQEKNRMSREELKAYLNEGRKLACELDLDMSTEEKLAYAYMNGEYDVFVFSPSNVFIRDMKTNEYIKIGGKPRSFMLSNAAEFVNKNAGESNE